MEGKKVLGSGLTFLIMVLIVTTMNNVMQSDVRKEDSTNIYNYNKRQYQYYMEELKEIDEEIQILKKELKKLKKDDDKYSTVNQNLNGSLSERKNIKGYIKLQVDSIRAYEHNNPDVEPFNIPNEEEIMKWKIKGR